MSGGGASSTAYTVQQGILYTATLPDVGRVVPEAWRRPVRLAMEATPVGRRRAGQVDRACSRGWMRLQEAAVLPGILLHYPVRKRTIEDRVLEALHAGAARVVVLAAGLDLLAWRLAPAWPTVQLVEVDLPATQADKRAALAQLGPLPAGLCLVEADLAHVSLGEALAGVPEPPGRGPTVVVAEALTMYLPPHAQETLLCQAREVCGPGGRLLVTFVRRTVRPGDLGPLLKVYLGLKREMLQSQLDPAEAVAWVERAGFARVEVLTGPDMTRALLGADAPPRPHDAEYLLVADVGGA